MKANEVPEKIYIHEASAPELTEKLSYHLEYIRKDAFIKKACKWIKEHKEVVETEDNGIIGWIPDYFIEDFKKYMEN